MPNWAMIIDTDQCIGCHACTVACKSEHRVPLGVNRCWVKSVEKGTFPTVGRSFLPVLCNQCADAPCLNICPTRALFRRPDGIVDLDPRVCIGCKACMAACPYDQIFIDPDTLTAEKCNFCANRVDNGLLPACVVVCPTQCRVFGDLDDPEETATRLAVREGVKVRKGELGTGPKILYLGADEAAIVPEVAWAEGGYKEGQHDLGGDGRPAFVPGGLEAPADAALHRAAGAPRIDYNVSHQKPWGERLVGYLAAKGVAAGAAMVALVGGYFGLELGAAPWWLSLGFTALTLFLLVSDLKQPQRFWMLLVRPNWKSWLVWGSWLLAAHMAFSLLFLWAAWTGRMPLSPVVASLGFFAALGAAAYSGFLFAQARGREFWQGLAPTIDLAIQAPACGAAALVLVGAGGPEARPALLAVLQAALTLHLLLVAAETFFLPPRSRHLVAVKRRIVAGPHAPLFFGLVLGAGGLAPLVLAALAGTFAPLAPAIAVLALAGMYAWDHIWVHAGQEVPLS